MKNNLFFIFLIFFSFFSYSFQEYFYEPFQIIDYFNKKSLTKDDRDNIIKYISNTFSEIYAFNEIAKNPPQPDFDPQYHTPVDIQKKLKEINTTNLTNYDFYREISLVLAELKDGHIRIFWNEFKFNEFFIRAPIEFYIQENGNSEPKIFGECAENDVINLFINAEYIEKLCASYSNNHSIYSINDMDPFEWINNFGGNFISTKNSQATFSFKLRYHNQVSLGDYPFTLEELKNFKVVFDNEEKSYFTTDYLIYSDIDIESENRLRNLENKKNIKINKVNKNNIKLKKHNNSLKRKSKIRKLETVIDWDYQYKDELKCIYDEANNLNIYYISTFWAENIQKYKETLTNCYTLFDNNTDPIIVINDLNNGGYISISQLFLGIISPLIPIDLYKGRLRITQNFTYSENIAKFLNSNFTNIDDCKSENFSDLINNKINVNHGNIKEELSKLFLLTNDTYHNEIENIRRGMSNKRKPTEILIFTDGYTLSSAAFFIKYLQKNGGGIVVGYSGNPKNNNSVFDSGQSASPLFNSQILKLFSKSYNNLVNEYNIELEMPGIQSFYDNFSYDTPIEYSVTPVDEIANIYEPFDELSYEKFVKVSNKTLKKYQAECNQNNKNLKKIDENCQFINNFTNVTHGGFLCNDYGKWENDSCVSSYCDSGYIFDKKSNSCVTDICSYYIGPDDHEEEQEDNKGDTKGDDEEDNSLVVVIYVLACIFFILAVTCFICYTCKRKYSNSPEIESIERIYEYEK